MQKPPSTEKKLPYYGLTVLLLAVYCVYSAGLFLRVGINSDYANLVLEASDILSGNLFLSDWNLTGITFFTTDLLFFIVGTAIGGTGIAAYYIAVTLMYYALLSGALLLLKTDEKPVRLREVFFFLAAGGLPGIYACDVLRAHTAVPAYLFFALFLAEKARTKISEKKRNEGYILLGVYTLLLTLAWAGDAISLIMGSLPILIVLAVQFIGGSENLRKFNLSLMGLTLLTLPLGSLLEKLWLNAGKVNKNSFLELKTFADAEQIGEQFRLYITSLLGMYNASFFGEKLLSFGTLRCFIKGLLLLIMLYIILKTLADFVRQKKYDFISVVLSLGFVFMSLLFILTDIAVDATSARYIGYTPIMGGVLILRFIKSRNLLSSHTVSGRTAKKIAAISCAAIVTLISLSPVSFKPAASPQEGLAEFLMQNGLTSGYAKFWNASHVTLASGEETRVRAIVYSGEYGITKFNWFCKNSWYHPEYSNFIVIEDADSVQDDPFGITAENVRSIIGKPANILTYEGYTIYVYHVDITDRIVK